MNAHSSRSIRRFGRHAAFAAICCFAITTPATADQTNGEPLTKIVRYEHFNMNSEGGVRSLHGRLRLAATQVCAPFKGGTVQQIFKWRGCVDQAIARAVQEIDQPRLTAYHLSQTGKTEAPAQVATDR